MDLNEIVNLILAISQKTLTMHYVLSLDIDECASDPCMNNANCTDLIDSFNCTCVDGYIGIQCETGEITIQICLYICHSRYSLCYSGV